MIIKRTIKYSIQNQQKAGSRVRMRVSYGGNRVDFQTGVLLNRLCWDEKLQRVISSDSNTTIANDLNEHLSQMLFTMIDVFRNFELRQIVPTPAELRLAFQQKSNSQAQIVADSNEKHRIINVQQVDNNKPKQKKNEFWKNFDEFVKVNGKLNDWTPATFEKFAALRNHL